MNAKKWQVCKNSMMDDTPYFVGRKKRENEPLHSGNVEESGVYFKNKEAAQIYANTRNRMEGNHD